MSTETTDLEKNLTNPVPSHVDKLTSRLITRSNDLQKLSFVRTTDARTALARGLEDYMKSKSIVWEGGRRHRFEDVKIFWAEPEEPAKYPSAAIVAVQEADYDASNLSPKLEQVEDDGDRKRYIRQGSEMVQRFAFVIWANDPKERMALVAMCEDAFEPVQFMTGFRLELPYYFNARATYEKLTISYDDSTENLKRRLRAIIAMTGNVPQYVPVGDIDPMKLRLKTEVSEGPEG